MGRDKYLHKIDLQAPALRRPLASSTPVYGHDYALAQEGQREELHPLEDAPSSPHSSWDETAKGLADPRKLESGAASENEKSSEDSSMQEQPFEGDVPLFPETVVRRKNQPTPQETERKSLSGSKSAASGVDKESVGSKRYHY